MINYLTFTHAPRVKEIIEVEKFLDRISVCHPFGEDPET